jgi:putative transposase
LECASPLALSYPASESAWGLAHSKNASVERKAFTGLTGISPVNSHHAQMSLSETPWPHAPKHQLAESGTYMVTVAAYGKIHHFRTRQRLEVLHRGLLTVARDFGWELEAWAVFSNHYHFVGHSPDGSEDASSLPDMLSVLHAKTAGWVNRLDKASGREVWHNFWETKLSYEKSYLARLNYVHQNAVKHGLVPVANQYPWCSAGWFERTASPAMVNSIYRFKTDKLSVQDEFSPLWNEETAR